MPTKLAAAAMMASSPATSAQLNGDANRANILGASRGTITADNDQQHVENTNEKNDDPSTRAIGECSVAPPNANWASTDAAAFTATMVAQNRTVLRTPLRTPK